MATNKYGAVCAAELCTVYVPPGGGVVVHGAPGWLTYCPDDDPGRGPKRHLRNPDTGMHEAVVAFVHSRLDEEEATAGAAGLTPWRHWPARSQNVVDGHDQLVVACPLRDIADQVATWGPTPVLASTESRRTVLGLFEQTPPGPVREAMLGAVRALAMAYQEHPEYDPTWTLREQMG